MGNLLCMGLIILFLPCPPSAILHQSDKDGLQRVRNAPLTQEANQEIGGEGGPALPQSLTVPHRLIFP
jgi:hypothetical protein